MQKVIGIVIVVAIIIFFVFIKSPKITNYPSEGSSVIIFGDSLAFGTGSTNGNDMATLLSKEIGSPIINMGVPGETSAQGLVRVKEVVEQNPKVVIVLFGGNDFLQKVPSSTTFNNIDNIVTEIQKSGAVVVLLGIQGGVFNDPYDTEFEKIAKKRGTLHVSNVLDGLTGDKEFMSDAVHPNDAGYKKIVERVLPVLRKGM
jgi:lysophospholipase L1-like esterase